MKTSKPSLPTDSQALKAWWLSWLKSRNTTHKSPIKPRKTSGIKLIPPQTFTARITGYQWIRLSLNTVLAANGQSNLQKFKIIGKPSSRG